MAGERVIPGLNGLAKAFWTPGSDGWNTEMDKTLSALAAIANSSVLSRVTAATLAGLTPSDGDLHIVTDGTDANRIHARDNGAWVKYTPTKGWRSFDKATDEKLIFDGTAWQVDTEVSVTELDDLSDVDFSTPPTTGQILRYDGANWIADDESGGGGSETEELTVEDETTAYSLVLADAFAKYKRIAVATDEDVTVHTNASQAIPIGSTILLRNAGAGKLTIVGAGGVTVNAQFGCTLVMAWVS